MIIRRVFFYWQFIAVGVLPAWRLIGASIFDSGGWSLIGAMFGAVALAIGMFVVASLIHVRKDVRLQKAVSWADVGVLSLWHALIVLAGFAVSPGPWLPLLLVIVGLAAFWFAVWELVQAARRRVREVIDLIEEGANPPSGPRPSVTDDGTRRPSGDPSVIVIKESPTEG